MSDYQVVIIGGRPAGASLAIRLGRQNVKTLLVDKATFPSLPSVPSGAVIYNQHMDMLEELGITESELFHPDGRIDALVVEYVNTFHAVMPVSIAGVKRSYLYGADRMKFDGALWEHASRCDSVTARSGFSVTGILTEDGKVKGIRGQTERGREETISADLVVGADGRFSFAAQQFEAPILEEYNEHMTTTYLAEWDNVEDWLLPHAFVNYDTGKGLTILMIPINTRKYIVSAYMRYDPQRAEAGVEALYHDLLEGIAPVAQRLREARRVTPVVGIKGVRNGYRQPAGDGWALVGDAYHYKDPVDGQGVYDALMEAKLLAEAIAQWQSGGKSWAEAGQQYADQARAAIHPMLLRTVQSVKETMYTTVPPFLIRTALRWLMTSPEFQRDFLRLLSRASDPARGVPPGIIVRAMLRGIARDLRGKPAAPSD
jgi:2-polyprenyl-6-methoxyphenol hydroxylase-like FAD-dependent oxidoreductase